MSLRRDGDVGEAASLPKSDWKSWWIFARPHFLIGKDSYWIFIYTYIYPYYVILHLYNPIQIQVSCVILSNFAKVALPQQPNAVDFWFSHVWMPMRISIYSLRYKLKVNQNKNNVASPWLYQYGGDSPCASPLEDPGHSWHAKSWRLAQTKRYWRFSKKPFPKIPEEPTEAPFQCVTV